MTVSPPGSRVPALVWLIPAISSFQLVADRAELRQQLVRALGRLVSLLDERTCLQAVLNLPDPLLQVGPTTERFSDDHGASLADKKVRSVFVSYGPRAPIGMT